MIGYIVTRTKKGTMALTPIKGKRVKKDIRREPVMPAAPPAKVARPRYRAYNAAKKAWSEHGCPVAAQEAASTVPGSIIVDRVQRAYMKWLTEGHTDWVDIAPSSELLTMSTNSTMSTGCGHLGTPGAQ